MTKVYMLEIRNSEGRWTTDTQLPEYKDRAYIEDLVRQHEAGGNQARVATFLSVRTRVDGQEHFWVRAMPSCSDEFIEAHATNEHFARDVYEQWIGEYDYVELWLNGERIRKSYAGENAFEHIEGNMWCGR